MILKWTDTIVHLLISENIISEREKDVYMYCVQTFLFQGITYGIILLLANCFDVVALTIAYYVGFLPIRYVAGGYHASNHVRCLLLTISVYVLAVIMCLLITRTFIYPVLVSNLIISSVLIIWAAPVDHKNRPFSPREKDRFRRRSYIITIVIIVLSLVVLTISVKMSVAMSLGTLSAACSLVAGSIQRRKEQLC